MMSTRTRSLLAAIAAIVTVACLTGIALAATPVQVGSGPYTITPKTYWTSIQVTCPAGDTPCTGVLSLETAFAIKPYSTRPKAKARVADVSYSVPAGTTKAIKARVYGPALAQAIKTHSVTLRMTAWESGVLTPVGKQVAVFKLAHP